MALTAVPAGPLPNQDPVSPQVEVLEHSLTIHLQPIPFTYIPTSHDGRGQWRVLQDVAQIDAKQLPEGILEEKFLADWQSLPAEEKARYTSERQFVHRKMIDL